MSYECVVLALLAVAFCVGWLGERARRRDLQWYQKLHRPAAGSATVEQPGPGDPATPGPAFTESDREQFIEDFMREAGCDRTTAESQVQGMISEAYREWS